MTPKTYNVEKRKKPTDRPNSRTRGINRQNLMRMARNNHKDINKILLTLINEAQEIEIEISKTKNKTKKRRLMKDYERAKKIFHDVGTCLSRNQQKTIFGGEVNSIENNEKIKKSLEETTKED